MAADLSQYEDSASSRNGDYEISDDYVSKAILKASRNSENAPQAKQIRGETCQSQQNRMQWMVSLRVDVAQNQVLKAIK